MGTGVDERTAAVADEMAARMEEMNPPSAVVSLTRLTGEDPSEPLIKTAADSYARFTAAPGPRSYLASARRLIQTYDLLHAHAILARRDKDGALLRERKPSLAQAFVATGVPAVQWEPWLPTRPGRVGEIPPFTPDNLALWKNAVADADNRALTGRTAAPPRKPDPAKKPDQLVLVGKQYIRPPIFPFLLYFGNHGKIITVVKTGKMSFQSEAGRVALLAYIIRVVAQQGPNGEFNDHSGNLGRNGEATPEQLALSMLNSKVIGEGGFARVFFAADPIEASLFERLTPGQSMQMIIDVHAIRVIGTFTNVKKHFIIPPPPKNARGCAAIEWMREILAEVPPDLKMLWVFRKIEEDRGIYPGGLVAGKKVPMQVFLPVDTDSEGNGREVTFLGAGDVPGELLIVTEEGRILALSARMRNANSYCTAVMSVAPWIAMFYLVAAVGGVVLAGALAPSVFGEVLAGGSRLLSSPGMLTGAVRATEIPRLVKWADTLVTARKWEAVVGAGLASATIAIDVAIAGGVQAYVKKLQNPWEAAFLLLNLLSIRAAFKVDDLARMIEESRALGQAAQQLQIEKKGLAGAAAVADRQGDAGRALDKARLPTPPRVPGGPANANDARMLARPPAVNPAGERQIGNRLGATEPAPGKTIGKQPVNDNLPPPKEPLVPANDIERKRLKKQAEAEKAAQARQPVAVDTEKKMAVGERQGGGAGAMRSGPAEVPAQGPGVGQAGTVWTAPGIANSPNRIISIAGIPIFGMKPIIPTRTDLIKLAARQKLEEGIRHLTQVTVALGRMVKGKFEGLNGLEAIRRLFHKHNRLSSHPALAKHWPKEDARNHVYEIQHLILEGAKDNRKLLQEFHIAFQPIRTDPESVGRLSAALLNRLPAAVREKIRNTVLARWNTIREKFWRNVYDDVALREELAKLGITFPKRGNVPVLRVGERELQITLDHISRKVDNPLEAFNMTNLRPMAWRENSFVKDSLVQDLRRMTGKGFDEVNRLPGKPPPLPKELADDAAKVFDDITLESDLFRGDFLF